jgi:hypothetical protein
MIRGSGSFHSRKLISLLVAGLAALAFTSAALAGLTTFSSQQGNLSPLPCLGAMKKFAGVITITTVAQTLRARDDAHNHRKIDAQNNLCFRFDPNDATLPSYTGTQVVSQHLMLDSSAESLDIPLTLELRGSDGSSATLVGAQKLNFLKAGGKNLAVTISDGVWFCA